MRENERECVRRESERELERAWGERGRMRERERVRASGKRIE